MEVDLLIDTRIITGYTGVMYQRYKTLKIKMKAGTMGRYQSEETMNKKGVVSWSKRVWQCLVRFINMDDIAVFKSRDWPHLWPK